MSIDPESIRQALSSGELGDRLRAVNQLRELAPAIAFELIQSAVTDAHTRVRYAAVSQLASLGQVDRATALNLLRDRLFHDPEADVQAAAADAIGALQLCEAFTDLEQVYAKTTEWLVQFSIIATLGELGDPRSFDLLATALHSEQEMVQLAAIGSFGELGDPRAVPLLAPYVSHPDWQFRYRLAQALSRLKGPEAQSLLQQLAQDTVSQVVEAATMEISA